jgi:hypothetical protein
MQERRQDSEASDFAVFFIEFEGIDIGE